MFFEDFVDHVELLAVSGGIAHGFDLRGRDHGAVVAVGLTDVGNYGGEFFIIEQATKGGHGWGSLRRAVVFSMQGHGTVEAFEDYLDQAGSVSFYPFAFHKGRIDVGDTISVRLVAGDAVGIAGKNLAA